MHVLRTNDRRPTPWKNGGGVTTEIAVFPHDAGLDAFTWRISMARIESDGPFSAFEGVDRTLSVLDGAGIRLTVDSQVQRLTPASEPFSFAGDTAYPCALVDGPVTDLNVMTRRGHFRHAVRRLALTGSLSLPSTPNLRLIFCAAGEIVVKETPATATLGRHDAVILDPGDVTLVTDGAVIAFVVSLEFTG